MGKGYNSNLVEKPVVSIIVPIYNGAQYISKCLDSLAAQTLENIQVILVNDGSKDNSEDICLSYLSRYPHFEYYHKENGGSATARNLGLEYAVGGYVGFVDSDDWVEADMFEKMYRAAKQSDADIVFNSMIGPERINTYSFTVPTPGLYVEGGVIRYIYPNLLPHPTATGTFRSFDWGNWSKLFRREIIEDHQIRYYNRSRRCEDLLFALECSIHTRRYLIMEHEALYHYCPSENSKSRHYTKNMWASISSLMECLKEIGNNFPDYDFLEAIRWCIVYFCVIVIRNEVLDGPKPGRIDRINEILRDPLWAENLEITIDSRFNKEYSAVFRAMRSKNARSVDITIRWWAFKKKKLSPILAKLRGR